MSPLILFIVVFVFGTGVSAINVTLTNNGPAVRGANVTFTATIVSGYTGEEFKFVFKDNGVPQHMQQIISTNQSVNYSVQYPRNTYNAGQYVVNLEVKKIYFENLWWTIAVASSAFNLTDEAEKSNDISESSGGKYVNYKASNERTNIEHPYPQWLQSLQKAQAKAEEQRAAVAAENAEAALLRAEALKRLADAADRQAEAVMRIAAMMESSNNKQN